ncbi:hypothetical protein CCAX7_17780 [Capsulimonas corticalis]|uniref:Uncharacterized protein n=1 Tax=Capsulimonas corticalis TaxID=2219043 RepID=A0A402D3R8_9BACT|nr:DUF72 domain-containing protein [Capsulimonas corticalis]BDI29727.1 hypothetical protein CCAX7_17780 [Capsulimonas corticalis]
MSDASAPPMRIGCAGWSIPKGCAAAFPAEGSHLERYAARLRAVEINSSFYRLHRPATYERWAASVPDGFQFSVKIPREITHTRKLTEFAEPMDQFLSECGHLGDKLGPLLVQLPPSLAFDPEIAAAFFDALRARHSGGIACEPRHASWFTPEAEALLVGCQAARVAADPAVCSEAARPGGWPGLTYFRLHGSPRIYYSDYSPEYLETLAAALAPGSWCVFDNTAAGAAMGDALALSTGIGACIGA